MHTSTGTYCITCVEVVIFINSKINAQPYNYGPYVLVWNPVFTRTDYGANPVLIRFDDDLR